MNKPKKNPKNLRTEEAAEYLRQLGIEISPNTMVMWRVHQRGPAYRKIVNKVYYDPEELERFAQGRIFHTLDSGFPYEK